MSCCGIERLAGHGDAPHAMISLTAGHLVGLAATLAIVLSIAVWSARSVKSAEAYSLCERSSGIMMVAGSIAGTCVGGAATIGTAQMAYSFGMSAWWFTGGVGLGLIVLAVFYAHPLRRSGLETLPQYLVAHYGRAAGPLISIISSLGILFSAVATALTGIALFTLIFAVTPGQAAAAIVVLVGASVFFSGLKGAGIAGLLKMAVVWVTLFAAGAAACLSLFSMADFDAAFPVFPWFDPMPRGAADCIGNLASMIVGIVCTQSYVQAIYSASNSKVAGVGALTAAAITIPVGLPCVAVGMFMHTAHPDIEPIMALPMYLALYLPPWLGGVGLAGLLFSIVGSIAGLALGIGTMLSNDIGRELLGIADDRRVLLLNRTTVVAVTCLATAIALANASTYVLDWNYMSMALRGAGVFVPLTLAIILPRRLTPRWALLSMAASSAIAVAGRFGLDLAVNPLFTGVAASVIVVCVGLALSPRPARQGSFHKQGLRARLRRTVH
jgi:SSS family solute:Na+ symporter